jgi:hypothetical protein
LRLAYPDGRLVVVARSPTLVAAFFTLGKPQLWRADRSSERTVVWNNVHAKGRMFASHTSELAVSGTSVYSTGADGHVRRCDIRPFLDM